MKKSISATIWSIFDRVWAQVVAFLIGIVLARLLTPEDYGLVGISMIFIAFANVFIDAGFSNALIRKLDRNQADYSTAFYFNAIMSIVMYALLFLGAPFIAEYFDDEQLTLLTRIISTAVVLNSLCIVQNAILTIEFRMKEQAIINIAAQVPAGVLAMYLAYHGLGVYALAVQTVLTAAIRTTLFSFRAQWLPSLEFSRESMRYLWGFGSKLIGANFLGTFFNEIYSVLIGKYVGKTDLGYYSKGRSLSTQPDTICNGVVQKVALPLLAQYQDNPTVLKVKYRELTQMITCAMTLVSGLLIVCAKPLILIIWGEQWTGTIPVFQLLIVANIVSFVSYLSLVLLQIINHTEYTLKLEFIKKPVFFVIIIISLRYGLYGLLASLIVNSLLATLVNISAPCKYIGYKYLEQFGDVSKYVISWLLGSLVVFGVFHFLELNSVIDLILRAVLMTGIYIVTLIVMKDKVFLKYWYSAIEILKIRK